MTSVFFEHYSTADKEWRWPNFTAREIACRDPSTVPGDHGELLVYEPFMDRLQALRTVWGRPLTILSGYRTTAHNDKIGGRPSSMHLLGRAVDVSMEPALKVEFTAAAHFVGFRGVGWYRTFIHIDDREDSMSWTG